MKKITLFESGQGGYPIHHIPGILACEDGSLLAYCEARRTKEWGDWAEIDILMRRSLDGGKTWFPRQTLATGEQATWNNPVMIENRARRTIHLLHNRDYSRCYHSWSNDYGKTFTKPTDITYALDAIQDQYRWNVVAFGPGHGIQLESGRLILPFWIACGAKVANGHPRAKAHHPGNTGVLWSDDDGDTWEAKIVVPDSKKFQSPNEAAIVELSNGDVHLNVRSPSLENRRIVAISKDQGKTWGKPRFDRNLFEPVCFAGLADLKTTSSGRKAILFSNPDSEEFGPREKGGNRYFRKNLAVRMSYDDGKTWHKRVIDKGEGAYSDLATDEQGNIYCLYGSSWDIVLATFDEKWINGKSN